jgi:hypothetical protein
VNVSRAFVRSDWDELTAAFRTFFGGAGQVEIDESEAVFTAPTTGFSIRVDGTSRSFMPLHRFGAAWDEIEFDFDSHEVHLRGESATYTYRIPEDLLSG